jgi:hypothetical protein
MSRLTGNDAKGLMEAYSSVYTPQELTEDQVWEHVEFWVNSLLEEGYDLSEYTWEEMYEAYSYLSEQEGVSDLLNPIGLAAAGLGALGMAKDAAGNVIRDAQTLLSRRRRAKPGSNTSSTPNLGQTQVPSPAAQPQTPQPQPKPQPQPQPQPQPEPQPQPQPETPKQKPPKGPNPFLQYVGSKAGEFARGFGQGGKGPQAPGVANALGQFAGSVARLPQYPLRLGANVLSNPWGAAATGAGAVGLSKPWDPKTSAGRFVRGVREDYEIGDILIDYLIQENYAQDEKSALSIIENMSKRWAISILENYFES